MDYINNMNNREKDWRKESDKAWKEIGQMCLQNQINDRFEKMRNLIVKQGVSEIVAATTAIVAVGGLEIPAIISNNATNLTHISAGFLALVAATSAGFAIKYNHDYKVLAKEKPKKHIFKKRK